MKWLDNLKSALGGKGGGDKVFGSLAEAGEYAKQHKGPVPPNPFTTPPPAATNKPDERGS